MPMPVLLFVAAQSMVFLRLCQYLPFIDHLLSIFQLPRAELCIQQSWNLSEVAEWEDLKIYILLCVLLKPTCYDQYTL